MLCLRPDSACARKRTVLKVDNESETTRKEFVGNSAARQKKCEAVSDGIDRNPCGESFLLNLRQKCFFML